MAVANSIFETHCPVKVTIKNKEGETVSEFHASGFTINKQVMEEVVTRLDGKQTILQPEWTAQISIDIKMAQFKQSRKKMMFEMFKRWFKRSK